jgi:5-methyltetrahydrofolate--homocysteine methyltransferase
MHRAHEVDAPMNFDDLHGAVETGDAPRARTITAAMLDADAAASEILNRALLPAMAVVGTRFREREIFLPDVLLAARAMKASVALLEPQLLRDAVPSAGIVVLGAVRGDLHDIGKNLVSVMLQGAGFRVVDLGTDVEPDAFIDAALENNAAVIGMSALLTTTMTEMRAVIERIESRGVRGRLRTIVGGAPVNAAFAAEIGADDFAPDAVTAVERVRALVAR